jgi:hypothetical protein
MIEICSFCSCDATRPVDPILQTRDSLRPRRFEVEYLLISYNQFVYVYRQSY